MPVRTVATGPRTGRGGEARVVLGLSGEISVQDGFADVPLELAPDQHFRPRSAHAWLSSGPTGSSARFTLDYSVDDGETWTPILSSESSGASELTIADGTRRSATHSQFFNHPDASDLPFNAVVRGNITGIGQTTPGSHLKIQLKGDVWSD